MKSQRLVKLLSSHSYLYLFFFPVLKCLLDQHLRKNISFKKMFPIVLMFGVNLEIWQSC